MSKIMISELTATTEAADSSFLAIDNGTTTNKITVEDFNANANATAKHYAEVAEGYATTASGASADATSAKNATEAFVGTASDYANAASTSAGAAAGSATEASGYVGSARTYASNAQNSAQAAAASAAGVEDYAKLSRSWAEGNTGVRVDEATNNSKYWAAVAQAAAGGGVTTFNGRDGVVLPQSGDYSSDQITHVNTDSTTSDVKTEINATKSDLATLSGTVSSLDTAKQATYTSDSTQWDTTPTSSSTKPVTSGGIKTELDKKTNETVIATRQTNLTASRKYEIGDQFIYNNTLYKATALISSGGTITIGGNATTADDIVSQISNFTNNALGTSVNIIGYTTYANAYTAPSDGYVRIFCHPTNYAFINCLFNNVVVMRAIGISNQQGMYISCFVRKGTKIHFTRDELIITHGADFMPLK